MSSNWNEYAEIGNGRAGYRSREYLTMKIKDHCNPPGAKPKTIFVFDKEENLIDEIVGIDCICEKYKVSKETVRKSIIRTKLVLSKYYFSYTNYINVF